MTLYDKLFLVLAGLQIVSLGVLAWAAARLIDSARRVHAAAAPAVREACALAETGRGLARRVRADGERAVTRVQGVAARVRQRVATTRRIAGELRPGGRQAAAAAMETGALVAGQARAAAARARAVGELGQRLQRVRGAAAAAAAAARDE